MRCHTAMVCNSLPAFALTFLVGSGQWRSQMVLMWLQNTASFYCKPVANCLDHDHVTVETLQWSLVISLLIHSHCNFEQSPNEWLVREDYLYHYAFPWLEATVSLLRQTQRNSAFCSSTAFLTHFHTCILKIVLLLTLYLSFWFFSPNEEISFVSTYIWTISLFHFVSAFSFSSH